jgi:hypothetical protein
MGPGLNVRSVKKGAAFRKNPANCLKFRVRHGGVQIIQHRAVPFAPKKVGVLDERFAAGLNDHLQFLIGGFDHVEAGLRGEVQTPSGIDHGANNRRRRDGRPTLSHQVRPLQAPFRVALPKIGAKAEPIISVPADFEGRARDQSLRDRRIAPMVAEDKARSGTPHAVRPQA